MREREGQGQAELHTNSYKMTYTDTDLDRYGKIENCIEKEKIDVKKNIAR